MSSELQSDKDLSLNTDLSTDDVVDLLSEEKIDEGADDKKNKDKEDDKIIDDKDDEKEDEDKDSKLEEEDEEEDKDKKEELEIEEEPLIVLPRKKEILKAFPELFKKFPQIEASLYRDRQFTEVFPDVDSARQASDKADTFDKVEEDLSKGDITKLLGAVKQSGQEAVNRLADDYLSNLASIDRDAYLHVVSGVIKDAVKALAEAGRDGEDEGLLDAARQLNVFMFGKKEYQPHQRLSEAKHPEADKLKKDQENWHNEKFESAKTEALDKVKNRLQSTVDINMDRKNLMTPYIKKNAVKDAMEILESSMTQDKAFQRTVEGLWKDARKANLSKQNVDKVISAYLTKAKTLLQNGVIAKARNDALKGMPGKRVDRDRLGRLPINNLDHGTRDKKSPKDIPQNMSTLDALNLLSKD